MPLFDYTCPSCGRTQEFFTMGNQDKPICCGVFMDKMPPSCSFKIKGARAANNYGAKFEDSYGKSPVNGKETGCTFNSNRGSVIDHHFTMEG